MRMRIITLILLFALNTLPASAQDRQLPVDQTQIQLSFAPVVKRVAPAVVNIHTERVVKRRVRSPFAGDPFFAPFFNDRLFGGRMRERVENTLGSGVIVSSDGLVVTNAHVIGDSDQIEVQLNDGRQYTAELALKDDPSDIALLRIKADEDLPFVPLEPSEDLAVGDLVIAIGNPFGVGQTVTSGIVSATARAASNINDFNFFIQTDAAINPGNSGGPLLSLRGGVVGINTAIFSRSGGSLGIGFSVPSEMVAAVIAAEKSGQVSSYGVIRPWFGATGQDLTPDLAQSFNLKRAQGVVLTHIHPKGPAADAGLKIGDIVLSINGRPIKESGELKFRLSTIPLGQSFDLQAIRDGQKREFKVKAVAPVEDPARDETTLEGAHIFNGVRVLNVSPAVEVEFGLVNQDEGVVISGMTARSPASRLGVLEGDGIIAINGKEIKNVKHLAKVLKSQEHTRNWEITLRRNGQDRRILFRG